MTIPDLDRSDFAGQDSFRSAPLFPETNRGVQQALSTESAKSADDSDDRSSAWRAVMASHLL